MKERVGGGNEVLIPFVKILKYQEYCELTLKSDVKDAYLVLCKNELCWFDEGVIEKSHSVVVELGLNRVIEVSIDSHALLRVNGEEAKGMEQAQVLDLNDDGERWEGDVMNNEPYGWGVVYDSENRKTYEGFRIGSVNVCYGTRYYSDIQKVEYEGGWFEGRRYGNGILYDRNRRVVFDGEWMDDEPVIKRVVLNEENQLLHNHIKELFIQDSSCNGSEWTALDLSFIPSLRLFEVGSHCFTSVNEVKVIGLNQLERVVIGRDSFWHLSDSCINGHFYVKNCERLRELKIGCYSFNHYGACEIENLPSLEVIEMGQVNEYNRSFLCASLELKSNSQRMK